MNWCWLLHQWGKWTVIENGNHTTVTVDSMLAITNPEFAKATRVRRFYVQERVCQRCGLTQKRKRFI